MQWWFKFCKGDKSLEDEALSGLLRTIIKADLTTAQEVAKELNNNYSMVIWNFKQIGKVKKLDKWVPHELTTNQKNSHFEVLSSLILCNNHEPFLDQIVICDEKWNLYENQ